jgi:hypothetical protein
MPLANMDLRADVCTKCENAGRRSKGHDPRDEARPQPEILQTSVWRDQSQPKRALAESGISRGSFSSVWGDQLRPE